MIPGVDALLGKEVALELPEEGLGEGLILFEDSVCLGWVVYHGSKENKEAFCFGNSYRIKQ